MSRQLNSTAQIYSPSVYRRPCPRWFISRGGGVVVPLIAADELPLEVKLVGVPRGMDLDGAARMEFLGEYRHDGSVYALETPLAEAHTEECNSDTVNGNNVAEVRKTLPLYCALITDIKLNKTYEGRKLEALIPTPTRQKLNNNHASHGFGDFHPLFGRKEYCTYWIRTGECAYARQGCLYKHEMPDMATLERLGFRSVPRWWRTKPLKPRAVGYRSGYVSDRTIRTRRNRSVTSSDESNEGIDDSRSEGGNWVGENGENGELDAHDTRSPAKSESPPEEVVKQRVAPPVKANGATSSLGDLIDLSMNNISAPRRYKSSRKITAASDDRTSSKASSSQKSASVTQKERRTSPSSQSRLAENLSVKARPKKQSPSRSRTPSSRRGKSDEEDRRLNFDPGPIASPSRYRWDDSHDTASISSEHERKAKDRDIRASARASRFSRA